VRSRVPPDLAATIAALISLGVAAALTGVRSEVHPEVVAVALAVIVAVAGQLGGRASGVTAALVAVRDGEVAGVLTAYPRRNEQVGVDLWYARAFVAQDHRRTNIAIHLAMLNWQQREAEFLSGADRRGLGTVVELENAALRQFLPYAQGVTVPMVFIGESKLGAFVLIRYFPGAKIV
jgi:hypothetical protein